MTTLDLETADLLTGRNFTNSNTPFKEFLHNSPMLAWITDAEGFIEYANPSYIRIFPPLVEVIGKNIFELYPQNLAKEYSENNRKVIDTEKVLETIEKGIVLNKNNNYKVIKFPVIYKERTMAASWATDITAQMETFENLSILNEHKNKLVSIIAHDLRGPIGINVTFLKTIIDNYSSYSKEELLESLKILTRSSYNCFELIDDLLRWAKSQLGGITYNPKQVNIQTEILKITGSLWDVIRQKNIQLKTTFNYYKDIYVDLDMFAVVLRNFITNAIKFSYADGEIVIETELHNDQVRITVKDSGTGMSEMLVQKLLNKINHESTFGTNGEKGTGLGLIMAKEYIEQNGGKMGIESKPGEGSKFYFTVPLKNISEPVSKVEQLIL